MRQAIREHRLSPDRAGNQVGDYNVPEDPRKADRIAARKAAIDAIDERDEQARHAEAVAPQNGQSWNTRIELRSIDGLKPHPLSVKIYGLPTADESLLKSVEDLGVLSAIVVDEQDYIISGTSRHYAAVAMSKKHPSKGYDKIPAVLFKGSALDGEMLVIESNRQRIKKYSQLGREFNERFRIEQEYAALRQQAGVPLPPKSAGGDARDRAARAVNLGRTKAEQLGRMASKADTGHRAAIDTLANLDAGEISVSAAYSKIFESGKVATPADCPVCTETFPSLQKLRKHARTQHNMEFGEVRKRLGLSKMNWSSVVEEPNKSVLQTWSIETLLSHITHQGVTTIVGDRYASVVNVLLKKMEAEHYFQCIPMPADINLQQQYDIAQQREHDKKLKTFDNLVGTLRDASVILAKTAHRLSVAKQEVTTVPAESESVESAGRGSGNHLVPRVHLSIYRVNLSEFRHLRHKRLESTTARQPSKHSPILPLKQHPLSNTHQVAPIK